jgi:hypothetical protein
MKRLVHAAIVLLAACGSSAKKGGGVGGSGGAPKQAALCIDVTAPGGTLMTLDREDGHGLVSDGDDKGVGAIEPGRVVWGVLEDESGAALAVTAGEGCPLRPCSPQIVRAQDGQITLRSPIPFGDDIQPGSDYPFVVEWMNIADSDEDGAREVWVAYQIVSPPEPAVGSTTHRYVAAFSMSELALRFAFEHGYYPEASSLERCDGELHLVDADCDDDRDLVVSQTCAMEGVDPEQRGRAYLRESDGTYTE